MKIPELILDEQLLIDLKNFLIDALTEQGVKKMFDGEDVSAYPAARDAIEHGFDLLEDLSGRTKDISSGSNGSPR